MPPTDKVSRESVDDVLEIVGTYGPWGPDINESLRFQIVLAEEVQALRGMKANLSLQSIVEWASSWVPESNRARFADALKLELAVLAPSAASPTKTKLPSLPEEIQEWCWHMDTALEQDDRHAAMALRAAWPSVSKWLQENVGPSSKSGVPFNAV